MMKYTNYILKGNVIDLDQIISEKPGWKQVTILLSLPVAAMALVFISASIPMALTADGYRTLKMRYYLYMKQYKRDRYYTEVFSSLTLQPKYKTMYKILLQKGYNEIIMDSTTIIKDISVVPFKFKLQYILSKGSYILTEKQMETLNILSRSYSFVRQRATW